MRHHILLFGGSGICGVIFAHAALAAGHRLTLYVRTPSKVPEDIRSHVDVTIIEGQLDNIEGLKQTASCGADTFVSFTGPTLGRKDGIPITSALKLLYPMLLENGTTNRILVLSTPSYSAPEDTHSFKWFMAIQFYIRLFGGDAYKEINGISNTTVALGDKIDWTLFRVPLLKGTRLGENDGDLAEAFVGKSKDGLSLDRGRLALWVLKEIDEKKWVHKCPLISNT
ncbi:hypothetical protein F5884DRAFT_853312 [Xylogone sp. PMI_703]|nr:hypothetical protein F5884DRAFT_853312 [Xylogone sp. PMI_703]